ncbi:hypothetical protein COT97_01845 [Candidatus Falkowbacteria bacterium CG10_big_fil_rev_8_21_14_0_10_39_11]|uniref:Uncharacterized protein n=1 Tax=Candidatus Falkowbacteria bacterium CG10_big_fil_rev_8_21_14_0_10_39_11 TaxID=1974565 RepID=A0A2H0V5J5_9BACT|nr:MAG: hypothetical protein COT97_01845 [Candidatus Falkowbacteria bacterium CG10_big_fil_rev_8_21_14_0_10_39_11]
MLRYGLLFLLTLSFFSLDCSNEESSHISHQSPTNIHHSPNPATHRPQPEVKPWFTITTVNSGESDTSFEAFLYYACRDWSRHQGPGAYKKWCEDESGLKSLITATCACNGWENDCHPTFTGMTEEGLMTREEVEFTICAWTAEIN